MKYDIPPDHLGGVTARMANSGTKACMQRVRKSVSGRFYEKSGELKKTKTYKAAGGKMTKMRDTIEI